MPQCMADRLPLFFWERVVAEKRSREPAPVALPGQPHIHAPSVSHALMQRSCQSCRACFDVVQPQAGRCPASACCLQVHVWLSQGSRNFTCAMHRHAVHGLAA